MPNLSITVETKKEHPKDVPLASNKDTIANTVGIKLTLAL